MRVQVNPRPCVTHAQPVPADLTLIRQPKPALGLGISILVGLGLPVIPFALLSLESWLLPRLEAGTAETIPWWIVFPAVIVCVLAHELLHVIGHPGWGRSDRSIVLIWPCRFQLGVYYEGFMKRSQWLVMRLLPLVSLTLLLTLFLLVVYPSGISFFWQQFVVLVILVNSLGAGGDLVAATIVARQVPAAGEVGTWNGRAYWRPAAQAGDR